MATRRKEGLVRCGAPRPEGGFCTRLTEPGSSCGYHQGPPVEPPPPEQRPQAKRCECQRPIPWIDDLGVRCVRCAGWLDLDPPALSGTGNGTSPQLFLFDEPATAASTSTTTCCLSSRRRTGTACRE
jgi:hypothetical protein